MPASPLYLPSIAPSTVEQAINAMITAGGEGPISGSVVHRPDREAAASLLDEALREILTEGWSFNTEHGLEITHSATIEWLGSDNTTASLNIFEPPPNLLSFKVTASREQEDLDFIVRPPRDWLGGPFVFYDRVLNRDGYSDRTSLYIDPTWLMDYEDLPQTARNVVFHRAVRRFLTQIVGDLAAADRRERDELLAFRHLKKEFGAEDRFNLFGNRTTARHFGFRFFDQSTVDDRRGNRSGAVGGAGYRTPTSVTISPNTFSLDTIELEEALQVPASITLRRSDIAMRLSNPNSGDVSTVDLAPSLVELLSPFASPVAGSMTLASSQVNLIAQATGTEAVASIDVTPNTVDLDAPTSNPVAGSILLVSSSVSLSTSAPSFTISAELIDNSVVNPGQARSGTITVARSGGFAGAITVSSTNGRVSFPNGNTLAVGQTTLAFTYTAPVGAANETSVVQITGSGTGVTQQAANFTVVIGAPSIDVVIGQPFNTQPNSVTQSTIQIVRTNYTGNVTVTANRPFNIPSQDRQNNINGSTPWVDVDGQNVIVTQGTFSSGGGSSTFTLGATSGTFFFSCPSGITPGVYNTVLTFSGPGITTIQRTVVVTVVSSGGGGGTSNPVASVEVTPTSSTLNPTISAQIPQSITLGSTNVSLTLS